MNQPTVSKQSAFKSKTPIFILSIVALIFWVLYVLSHYMFRALTATYAVSLFLGFVPLILFIVYMAKFRAGKEANSLLNVVFASLAIISVLGMVTEVVYAIDLFRYLKEYLYYSPSFWSLILNFYDYPLYFLIYLAAAVFFGLSAISNISKKTPKKIFVYLAVATQLAIVVLYLFSCAGYISRILTSLIDSSYIIPDFLYYLVRNILFSISTVAFNLALVLLVSKNAPSKAETKEDSASAANFDADKELNDLFYKYIGGLISQAEYETKRQEILNKSFNTNRNSY